MGIPYLIKSWRGGQSDEADKGIAGAFKHSHNIDIHKIKDSLSANQAALTVLNPSELIKFFVSARNGSTYGFCHEGSILERTSEGAWQSVYTDANKGIRGATEFSNSSGEYYLYWATATSLARKQINGNDAIPWADVSNDYKTTLESVADHTMKVAGGELAIANGQYLATLSYQEAFNAQDLNIIPGNLIRTLEEHDDDVIFGSKRLDDSEEAYLWKWNFTATNWNKKKKIPAKGINALLFTESPLSQAGEDGELFFTDFQNIIPLHAINGGGKVNPAGADIYQDLALFGFYGGSYPGLWSYGRKRKNRPHTLNFEYRLKPTIDGSSVAEIGAIKTAGGVLLASWQVNDGSTITYGVDQISSTTKANALFEGLEFNGGVPNVRKNFTSLKITMEPLPSGTSIAVKYRPDRASTGGDSSANAGFKYAKVASSQATTYSITGSTEAEFILNSNAKTIEIGMELFSLVNDTPEILAITANIEGGDKH